MEPIFQGDSYDTPEDYPRHILDRLALNTRLYFDAGVIKIINQGRVLANKGVYNDQSWVKSSFDILKLIEACGGKFHFRGLENISSSREPVIFISNHMSTLETFVFPCIIEPVKDVSFVVKESLVKHFFFGPIMRSRDPVVVGRNNPREDFRTVIDRGQELVKKGISVIIFPQSTRTDEFCPEEFNTLGIKLAKACGVKVIPVAIKTDFWGNGKYIKDLGPISRDKHIYMVFGQPITVKGSGKEEHNQIMEFIQTNLNQWK